MLSSIIRRSVTRTTLHRFYVSLAANNYTLTANQRRSKKPAFQCITLQHNAISYDHFLNPKNDMTKFLPLLPGIVYKRNNGLENIRILFLEHTIMRILLDPEFNIDEVLSAIREASCAVSLELANKNYDALEGLVTKDTLKLLKEKIDPLSESQRNLIAMRKDNVRISFPAFMKVREKSDSEGIMASYSMRVEINVVFHYEPCYGQPEKENDDDEDIPENLRLPRELVANYTFFRDYSNLIDSDWRIKYINIDTKPIF